MNDNQEVATVFQATADVDRCEHFEKEFSLAEWIGTDLENLGAALHEKSRQIEMYARFQEEALSDGDTNAAHLFEFIRADELRQLDVLTASVQKLGCEVKGSLTTIS